ncbi:unnamed protein product [Symbiodinium sp. CCMP2592]|nr:unnamed protein product [Symbiodinium sp. CCMP2592]
MTAPRRYGPLFPLAALGIWLLIWGQHGQESVSCIKPSVAQTCPKAASLREEEVAQRLFPGVVSALQSIQNRSTQDLWGPAAVLESQATAEQRFQRRSNAANRLSKRLSGNMRAKEELATALQQWFMLVSQRLVGLITQVRALGSKLDEDTTVAAAEMRDILAAQPSELTTAQVVKAEETMGPIWSPSQEHVVMQLAAGLKAFGTVLPAPLPTEPGPHALFAMEPPQLPSGPVLAQDGASDVSFGQTGLRDLPGMTPTSTPLANRGAVVDVELPQAAPVLGQPDSLSFGSIAPTVVSGRWRKRSAGHSDRPSKSPRRDHVEPPWTREATGRTPDSVQRAPQVAVVDDGPELIPDPTSNSTSPWTVAWLAMLHFCTENGADLIGELRQCSRQDAALPLTVDAQAQEVVALAAEAVWEGMLRAVAKPELAHLQSLHRDLREVMQQLWLCSNALPSARQGLLVAAHLTAGRIVDPFSYAPSTAQEWLFPDLLLEADAPIRGFIAKDASQDSRVQVLLRMPSPFLRVTDSAVLFGLRSQIVLATLLAAWLHPFCLRVVGCGWGMDFYPHALLALSWASHHWMTLLLLYLSVADGVTLHLGAAVVSSWGLRSSTAVQLHAHGFHEGLPVLSTGPVLPTPTAEEMCEVYPVGRTGNLLLPRTDRSRRHLAAFVGTPPGAPILEPCPVPFLVDEWLHGPLLHARLAATLGFPAGVFSVSAIRGVLPGLPSEQLLLTPAACSWRQVWLPVDLRPLGGRICMLMCPRDSTCRAIAVLALAAQTMQTEVDLLLAKCPWGWLTLMSQPLLLQDVDTLQFHIGPAADALQGEPPDGTLSPRSFPGLRHQHHTHLQVFLITCRLWWPGSSVRLEFANTESARDAAAELYRQAIRIGRPQIEYSADHVLEAAQIAAASADVQILRGTAHRLRQGDVVRVRVNTEARTLDVSAFVIPHNVGTASRWLQEGRIVSLLHPVAGVLSFEVPRACDLDTSVLGALLRSVTPGQHVFVALPGADLLPHAAFVAAFPGQDCVTYRVTDASDPSAVGLHLAFSGVFESFPAFLESLLRSNRPADFARAREHLLSLSWAPPSVCGAGVTPDSASELVDLWCDAWHVKCLVACLPGFTVWALREGSRLYGMCTPVPSWEAVAQALSLSLWELPQTFLSSDSRVWPFPRDITGVAMQCVSVGYDSPEGVSQLVRNCEAETPSPPPPPGPLASAALGLPCLRRYSLLCALSLLLPVVSVRVMVEPAPLFSRLAESETLQTRRDFSRPCTMSWTHELARQTHGFALSAPQLGAYVTGASPHPEVQMHLWLPGQGPVHLRVGARHLDQHLSAYLGAFLPDCEYGLHVAFDSSPQVLDLIVSPPSPYGWWILRDSIGCELLRPVVQHYTSHCSFFFCAVEPDGAVHNVEPSAEVRHMSPCPQGARALITSVLPGLEGKLVDGVLKIVAARARLPSLLGSLALLLLCRHVASMQPPQLLALAPVAEASPPPPTTIRIWTLNINAPVDLPWRPQGYPTRWLRELMCRLHHIDDPGEFRPTHSTTDSSVQHVLFVPVVPATRPTVRFWLLHWGDAAAVTFGHSPFSWDVVSAHLRALFPGGLLPERSPALSYAGQLYPPGVALPDFPSGAVIQILIGALARIPGDDDPWNPDPLVVEGPYFRHVPSRGPALEPAILLDGHGNRRAAGASHVPLIDQEVQTDLSGNGTGLDHATVSRVHMLSQELSFHTSRLWAGLAEPDAEPAGESQPVLRLASQSTCAAVSPSTVDLLDIASVSNCRRQDRLSVVVLSLVCTRGLFGPSAFGRLLVLATVGAGSIISAPPASSDDEQSEDAGPPPVQAFNMSAAEPTPVSRPAGPPPPEPVNAPFQPRMWFLRAARPLEDYALGLWPSSVEREPAADEDTVRRVQADLLGLQRGLRTFAAAIPLGTPFCIHNPFTARQQCELVEYSAGPEINPFVLFRGHARSRGWADIVLLQPQPDATAVHLIGCPQAPGNAAVGIVLEGRLVPCCLPVCVGTAALRALQLDGSEYDLRPPEVQEGSSVVQFRNGDCLAVRPRSQSRSPPPPEQVAAFAALTSEAELAAGSPDIPFSSQGRPVLSWGCFSLIFCRFTPSMCLSLGLLAGAALAQGMHRPGGFPWGTDPINRDFSAITAEDPVYVVLHSPFLGVFPPYTASHDTRHGQVWAQFLNDDPGWASDFFPVWPGPAFNELSMVPVGQDAALVTIMLMWRGHHRATLTPRTMTVAWLTAFISRHINSPVDGISLPHGLAICELFDVPPAAFRFRNGDVVYIHDPPEDPSEPLEFVDPWHLQDGLAAPHAPWATGFQLMFGISVHLLRPNRPPLLASVSAGEAWCPESFTFTGTFRNHFPGMWTPVQWSGARALQLIEVHGVAAQVNVVAASPEGRLCRTVDRIASRDSLADQLHFLPGSLQVGGVPSYALNQACELRNGDVVFGDFARGACSGRPLLWGLALGLVPAFSSCRTGTFLSILLGSLGAHSGFFSRLLMLTWCLHGAQAMVPETSVLSQTTSSVIPPAAPPRVSVTVANPFAPWHRVEADPRHLFDDVMADAHRTLTSWHRGFAATGLVLEGPNGTQRQLQCYIMRLSLATTAGPPAMVAQTGFFLLHSVSWGGALSSLPNSLLSSSGFLNLCGERPPVPLAAAPARFFPPAIDFNDGEPYVPLGGWQPDNPDGPLARYFPGPRPLTARVLCPLRGWSETSFLDTTRSWRSIEQEGTRHCGLWAHRFFPVRAVLPISQITIAPVAPYGLATVALHIEGCSAVAFASVDSSLDDIHRLAVRVFPHTRFWRVIAPPVLRTTIPNAHIRLRNGDAFSLLPEPSDPGATRYPLLQYASLDRARQVASWSLPFRFDSGGYVCLWYTGRRSGHSIRIRDTGYWDPEGPTFWSLNGRALSGSWVPVLSGDFSSLHLVHSTSTGEAHVLLLLPPDLEPQGLLLAGCNAYRAPPGWRLLPALQYVRADSPLRDGDVLVLDPTADTVWDPTGPPPQSLAGPAPGPVARPCWGPSSSAAAAISGRWAWLAVLSARWPRLLALACLVCAGQGMAPALDLPEQPIRVGFFPWRAAAAAADLVDLTNRTEIDIVLLSPFTGPQEAGRLPTASTTGELNALTRSCDPAWGAEVAPVWPTAAIPALLVVPRPLTPDLVCLAVSSLDRHFSILVPCTTSVSWLGAALRFLQPMQTLSVRAPSALTADATSDQGVRWRSGDLVVALPPAAFAPEYQPPCFHSDAQVRHCAIWAVDFSVSTRVNFILWRPAVRAIRGHAPAGSRWRALDYTFDGDFSLHYPGRWVPVPWIAQDHAHLVLLPEDPSRVNVIVEADGHCWCALVTAVTDAWQLWTELPSISSQPRVLGVPHQELRQGTTLRSGDVVSGCPGLSPSCWLPCSLGLAAWWALGSASSAPGYLLMFAGLLALPPVSGARLPHEGGSRQWSLATSNCDGSAAEPPGFRHRLWDPARGLLGPFPGPSLFVPPALQEAAPAWSDFTRVRPPQDHRFIDWVPVPSAPLFATVLLQCPPATRAALLPATCAVADLARASSHFIPDLSYVLAPPEAWCGTATTCTPTLFLRSGDVLTLASAHSLTHAPAGRGPAVQCPSTEVPCAAPSLEPQQPLPLAPSLSLRIVTANVQTMRDSCASFFNPSGHGQRRQYLYSQVAQLGLDVVCLQETRSKGGRWDTAGLLTWRSGAQKGSYGCEIWVRPQMVNPPLRLDDWRIACADPRLLVIVCKRADLPLAVVAAHAPHADRPVPEIHHFWSSLQSQLCQLPRALTLVLGLDANADLLWADDDRAYIGDALGNGEEGAGEQGLFDTIQRFGLLAPASFSDLQDGPGWSWEHTGGTRKRLDHILLQAGPWSCRRTRQLPELDILNGRRDHMPLLARAIAADLWGALPSTFRHIDSVGAEVQALKTKHSCLLRALPRPPRRPIRQPYITAASVAALDRVRQAREQLPRLRTNLEWQQRRFLLQVWRLGCTHRHPDAAPLRPDPTGLQHARLLLQACNLHVRGLQQKAHYLARSDKLAHFRTLTLEATKHWEATGVPLESIRHLRWASRKAHERRSVHAAGGFDIDSELEAQFRDQEGASLVSPVQLSSAAERWMNEPRLPCAEAVPTLLQMEQMCVRQAAAKAPGPDGLRNELWRAQGASAGQWLWPLCVRIALQGREPFAFKAAIVCALYKKGPASLPANYRSIALLNGIAKLWHSHLRSTVGGHVLSRYEPMQLGGRKGVHTGFALAAFRCAWDLSISAGRCVAVVFVDIQAAYYEASRDLLFEGFPDDVALPEHHHLAGLVLSLQQQGALAALGVAEDVVALLRDCVALSHWSLSGSSNIFLASRGSRPGDGLADILFGALFAVGLQHIQRVATRQGIVHTSAGAEVGLSPGVKPIGWADDLAVMADFDRPADLLVQLPVLVGIILDTLRLLRFRVNLGAGKTEALVDIRGEGARAARGVLLTGDAMLKISDSDSIRLCPEYKYLGVAQLPRDTGRRDCELAAQRGAAAASLARTLLCSNCLPWELKRAWVAGRVLPSAYSSLAMSLADSGRATAPLAGLFDRTARILLSSWQVGHKLTTPLLRLLADITPPDLATTISQCRLCVQLFCKAPTAVREIVDAAWNRALPWCQALVAACMRVGVALEVWDPNSPPAVTVLFVHTHSRALLRACKALSKFGHRYFACAQLWDDLSTRKATQILGPPQAHRCPVCSIIFPSLHAVRAHMHRKHGVLSDVTAYMAGSVCLWCMHDFHSSDRLKYHLQSHRACLHGLRVTVGPVYQYGSGTKRKGRTAHRGVPPQRLCGPCNATPAQRRAADLGLPADEEELQQEWDTVQRSPALSDLVPGNLQRAVTGSSIAAPTPAGLGSLQATAPVSEPSLSRLASSLSFVGSLPSWFSFVDGAASGKDWALPTPWWPGLLAMGGVFRLPPSWHCFWPLWSALELLAPWEFRAFRSLGVLRRASSSGLGAPVSLGDATSGRWSLLGIAAALISFRMSCKVVLRFGALWIPGRPSQQGLVLLRRLLPSAVFLDFWSPAGPVFLAASSASLASSARAIIAGSAPAAPPPLSLRAFWAYPAA